MGLPRNHPKSVDPYNRVQTKPFNTRMSIWVTKYNDETLYNSSTTSKLIPFLEKQKNLRHTEAFKKEPIICLDDHMIDF